MSWSCCRSCARHFEY
ncbi:hypothetical protein D018_2356A, partial [Vibrio parahaemolyticus VP2007-007]